MERKSNYNPTLLFIITTEGVNGASEIKEFSSNYAEFSGKCSVTSDYFFNSEMGPLSQYSPLMLHLSRATRILSENPVIFFIEHHPRFQLVKNLVKPFFVFKTHKFAFKNVSQIGQPNL